jgi:hypothetical protein
VCQGTVLELGDDLLEDRVVTVSLVGLDGREGGVGDEPVMAVGVEQFALSGMRGGVEPLDAADHQPADDVLVLAAGGEREERHF